MTSDREREVLERSVLGAVGSQTIRLPKSEANGITGFLAMTGRAYRGELMVIGRAVNGWLETPIAPYRLSDTAYAVDQARAIQQKSTTDETKCPMRWITCQWSSGDGYHTNKSAFWRCVRQVVGELGVADISDAGDDCEDCKERHNTWSSLLAWSNLYKLSRHDGGNPSQTLRKIQRLGCLELFDLEMKHYKPKRLLFLTGIDWAEPFLGKTRQTSKAASHYVEDRGFLGSTRYVVAKHPQGKPESEWTKEVIDSFEFLQTQQPSPLSA